MMGRAEILHQNCRHYRRERVEPVLKERVSEVRVTVRIYEEHSEMIPQNLRASQTWSRYENNYGAKDS